MARLMSLLLLIIMNSPSLVWACPKADAFRKTCKITITTALTEIYRTTGKYKSGEAAMLIWSEYTNPDGVGNPEVIRVSFEQADYDVTISETMLGSCHRQEELKCEIVKIKKL